MSDGKKRPLTKMLWSVSIKTMTFASVNTCNGSFKSGLKLLKQYRTIEQMCSDAHSITLNTSVVFKGGHCVKALTNNTKVVCTMVIFFIHKFVLCRSNSCDVFNN